MPLPLFDPLQLTGRTEDHVLPLPGSTQRLHRGVLGPFQALQSAAAQAGIVLQAQSGFRDFSRQLAIWNGKCRGELPLLGPAGELLEARALTDEALVEAILQWSALPGASRHHWGTDIDVIDSGALFPGQRVRLEPEAYAAGGEFAALGRWLDANAEGFGFYRPYQNARGGVRPEPWHLSYAPLAAAAERELTVTTLREALAQANLDRHPTVMGQLPELFDRYVRNVEPAPGAALGAAPAILAPTPS